MGESNKSDMGGWLDLTYLFDSDCHGSISKDRVKILIFMDDFQFIHVFETMYILKQYIMW